MHTQVLHAFAVYQQAPLRLLSLYRPTPLWQVELVGGPDEVAKTWQALPYPHMTLALSCGARGADALQLPALLSAGYAVRIQLEQPLPVRGVVLAFT